MRKILSCFLVLLLLVGCTSNNDSSDTNTSSADSTTMESFDDSYYKIVVFEDSSTSELRESFYTDYGDTGDFISIGRGLQILSSDYFSTSNYYMSEGQYLSLALKDEMMTRSSDYSLQPASGTVIEDVENPIMVQNVQEQDYYTKGVNGYDLKGMAFSIIIDPRDSSNTTLENTMSDSAYEDYGSEVIDTFYNIIQTHEDFEDVKDVPILITVYQATDLTSSTVGGSYILECYCDGSLGVINEVDNQTVLFTSDEAEELDSTTYDEFVTIKTNLKDAAQEAAGLVGTARYVDGEIQSMVIEANLNVKTSTELMYLTSIIADGIDSKFSYDFDIKVLVYSQDDLQAVIIKHRGESSQSEYLY